MKRDHAGRAFDTALAVDTDAAVAVAGRGRLLTRVWRYLLSGSLVLLAVSA